MTPLAKWRGKEVARGEVMLLDEAQLVEQEQIQMLTGRVAKGGAMVWMGDLAQDGEHKDKAMRAFMSNLVQMQEEAERGDTTAQSILQQIREGNHIRVVQFMAQDIVRSAMVKLFTLLQQYLDRKRATVAEDGSAVDLLTRLSETVGGERTESTEEKEMECFMIEAVDQHGEQREEEKSRNKLKVALSTVLFKLQAGTGAAMRKCAQELAANVSKLKQHLFIVTACPAAEHELTTRTWAEETPSNVLIIPLQELLTQTGEYKLPREQLHYELEQGSYPHAIELPGLMRHLVMAHPRCAHTMEAEGIEYLLTADVNDIWTEDAISMAADRAKPAKGGVTHLQDAATTCSTAPNLAATLAGGVCIHTSKIQDYLKRMKEACREIFKGCENLTRRRFTEQVKGNYKRLSMAGYPMRGTVMQPTRLMIDQAVPGMALALQPSIWDNAIEVQHNPMANPPGWYGLADEHAYLQDTVINQQEAGQAISQRDSREERVIDLTDEKETQETPAAGAQHQAGKEVVDLTEESEADEEPEEEKSDQQSTEQGQGEWHPWTHLYASEDEHWRPCILMTQQAESQTHQLLFRCGLKTKNREQGRLIEFNEELCDKRAKRLRTEEELEGAQQQECDECAYLSQCNNELAKCKEHEERKGQPQSTKQAAHQWSEDQPVMQDVAQIDTHEEESWYEISQPEEDDEQQAESLGAREADEWHETYTASAAARERRAARKEQRKHKARERMRATELVATMVDQKLTERQAMQDYLECVTREHDQPINEHETPAEAINRYKRQQRPGQSSNRASIEQGPPRAIRRTLRPQRIMKTVVAYSTMMALAIALAGLTIHNIMQTTAAEPTEQNQQWESFRESRAEATPVASNWQTAGTAMCTTTAWVGSRLARTSWRTWKARFSLAARAAVILATMMQVIMPLATITATAASEWADNTWQCSLQTHTAMQPEDCRHEGLMTATNPINLIAQVANQSAVGALIMMIMAAYSTLKAAIATMRALIATNIKYWGGIEQAEKQHMRALTPALALKRQRTSYFRGRQLRPPPAEFQVPS